MHRIAIICVRDMDLMQVQDARFLASTNCLANLTPMFYSFGIAEVASQ